MNAKLLISLPRSESPASLGRRDCLRLAATSLLSAPAWAQDGASPESALAQSLRQKNWSSEGIALGLPALADTGNAVPLDARIQAPQGLILSKLEIILPENPNPVALTLQWPVPTERFVLGTRLRLAASQSVWVVVTYSDGSQRARSAATVVTSTACLDGT
jgi:sulfur-oxidizing protein SoxY